MTEAISNQFTYFGSHGATSSGASSGRSGLQLELHGRFLDLVPSLPHVVEQGDHGSHEPGLHSKTIIKGKSYCNIVVAFVEISEMIILNLVGY